MAGRVRYASTEVLPLQTCARLRPSTRTRSSSSCILDGQRAGVRLEDEPFELLDPVRVTVTCVPGDGDAPPSCVSVYPPAPVCAMAPCPDRRGATARAAAVGQRGRGEQRQRHRRQRQESTRHHGCRLSRGRAATVSPRRRVHRRHLTTTRGCDTRRAPRESVRYSARAARQCRPRRATRRFLLFPSDDR